ncbi:hypothetical protein BZA77DRAFT_330247 [Pyronema omphalodes]|nr:hypothetical protein BZA77DRAFT_330247 [Pyronema omphalodes]
MVWWCCACVCVCVACGFLLFTGLYLGHVLWLACLLCAFCFFGFGFGFCLAS